jgi:hypothetical protein
LTENVRLDVSGGPVKIVPGEAIVGRMKVYGDCAWNIGIIADQDSFPVPKEPLSLEIHASGSMAALEETGKREPVAILREGERLVAFFTLRELEHAISMLRDAP